MPPATETERQKLLLQQEIAKLSGAITQHANSRGHAASYHPYRGYSSARGTRARGRGRGRGGSYGLDLRGAGTSSSTASSSAGHALTENKESAQSNSGSGTLHGQGSSSGWIKQTSKRGNMTLMTVEKKKQLAARPPPLPRSTIPPQIQVLHSTAQSSPGGSEAKRVVIDGIIFQFEQGGKKLVRIGEITGNPGSNASASTPTRQSVSYGGENYRRTKRGNLISRNKAAHRAEQAKKPCRYYTKTGRCERALTCPYQHIPDRLAICPKYLRSNCPLGADSCPLSHTASPHNTPSCVHFQASATCRNGNSCLYPHVRVAEGANVCEAFAREGWCDRPSGTCQELHVWECPEWHAKGTCSRGSRCGLRHVIRAEKGRAATAAQAADATTSITAPDKNGFDDQSEFIGLPGEVFSETESEHDENDEDEDENDDGEESEASEARTKHGADDDLDSDHALPSPVPMDTDDDDEAQVLGEV